MLKNLLTWAIAHPESALLYATLILSIPGVVYAAVKTAVQKVTGRPAKGGAWTVMDVVVETLPNIPGAINRLVRARGAPSIFAPASAPPPPSDGQRGAVRLGAMLALCVVVLVLSAIGALASGCRPPADCDVGRDTWRCSPEGIPQHCDVHNRWRAWATVPCARVGQVCALRDGRTTCVRPSTAAQIPANPFNDAGADAPTEGGL